ncbi:MAG: radical SAM family heme chaperone HemW [bacterium]
MRAGLYIHIPFCRKKCNYCDFYSLPATSHIPDFLSALKLEMNFYRDFWPEYDTLYVGGGTPSLLKIRYLADLTQNIQGTFTLSPEAEWTIEINPDDVALSYLQDLRALGFNRLSLGIQSVDDRNLAWLGRRHTAAQSYQAIEQARKAGFANLSLDLIYGLPRGPTGYAHQLWLHELEQILAYKPEHLSCYQLSFEPHTPLSQQVQSGLIKPLDESEELRYFLDTDQHLHAAGYMHYEVSNFSRGGEWISRHNHKYWQHVPYLGLGPSAHSFRYDHRHWNHRSLTRYSQDIFRGIDPVAGKEDLGRNEFRMETLYFGFRTRDGLDLEKFYGQFGQDLLADPPGLANRLIREKKLEIRNGRLCPTPRGLALADALALLW